MCFSQRLKELRIEKPLTQKELAKLLNLSPNSICEWEKERCEPSMSALKKLSKIFECSIDYLIGNSDDFGNITITSENLSSMLSDEELQLLEDFRSLPRQEKAQAAEYVHYLASKRGNKSKHT